LTSSWCLIACSRSYIRSSHWWRWGIKTIIDCFLVMHDSMEVWWRDNEATNNKEHVCFCDVI
jgi:hypothetical protein